MGYLYGETEKNQDNPKTGQPVYNRKFKLETPD